MYDIILNDEVVKIKNGNLDERIFMGKFVIVFFRIIYVILILLSIGLLIDGSYKEGIAFGVTGIIIIFSNVFIKSYKKKLESLQKQQNSEFEKRAAEIMNERQKIADELNKNSKYEIDESKIIFSESDKKRIEKNCNIMKKKGLPYMSEMKLIPFDSIVNIRSKEEIAKQMVKEFCIAHKAVNRLEGISDINDQYFITTVLKFQPIPDVLAVLSQISNGEFDNVELTQLAYLYERANVYMWVLGLGDKPLANKQCLVAYISLLLDKYKNMEDLINKCKIKSYEEIMEYADLITRYEWAMIELNKDNEKSKHINKDSVMEQKRAMDWVVSFDSNMLLKRKD